MQCACSIQALYGRVMYIDAQHISYVCRSSAVVMVNSKINGPKKSAYNPSTLYYVLLFSTRLEITKIIYYIQARIADDSGSYISAMTQCYDNYPRKISFDSL